MINRHTLRTKVFQSLFAYYQEGPSSLAAAEKHLGESLDRIYDLFLYELMALVEIRNQAEEIIEVRRTKKLPTADDLNPNTRFMDHPLLVALQNQDAFSNEVSKRKIHWKDHKEVVRRLFTGFSGTEAYEIYMNKPDLKPADHSKILLTLYQYILDQEPTLEAIYEEAFIHWADDVDAVRMMVGSFLKDFKPGTPLPALFSDVQDRALALRLLRQTALHTEEYDALIESKVQNWDMERIALTDRVLMRMALAEFIHLEEVPPKVTMNEYIELSKEYSTPKSAVFINGILDKSLAELKEAGRVKKIGRGLL